MDDVLEALARLTDRLDVLERRVCELERARIATPLPVAALPKRASAGEPIAPVPAGGLFPVAGKAMLGIAGAYLLRAAAESGSFPKTAVIALALAYAAMWLILAARVPQDRLFASAAYASTSALILSPMLWELTLGFHVLTSGITASILTAYVMLAAALVWKRAISSTMWVTMIAGVATSLALLVATRNLAPFVSALLVMALVSEIAAHRHGWLALRLLAASGGDIAIWILLYIYSRPASARSEYGDVAWTTIIALAAVFFLIYGTSVALRTVVRANRISISEIAQCTISYLFAAYAVIRFAPSGGAQVVGALSGILAIAGYTVTFAYLKNFSDRRNYHVYAWWSSLLLLAGSVLALPTAALGPFLCLAAVVATVAGLLMSRLTLEFHGLVYLAVAALVSGLLDYAVRALTGSFPAAPDWTVWLVSAAALLCYGIAGRVRGERWTERVLQLISAALAVSAAATFLISAMVWLESIGMTPGASHVAVIRTLITCALALALAFAGSHWQRLELVWIAYGMLAFVTAKLLLQDLRQGHPGATAISIFLYALALIVVPRMSRLGREPVKQAAKSASQ